MTSQARKVVKLYDLLAAGIPGVDDSTIEISNGSLRLKDGGVTAAKLAAEAVTPAKLSGAMATGYIPLSINTARIIATNAIQNTTEAGVPDGNTNPSIARVNGATDKQVRLVWAASNSAELAFEPVPAPPDLDDGQNVTVHLLAAMAGSTDTPVVTVGFFEGVGDTDAGGDTAAVTGTTPADYSFDVDASDVGAAPTSWAITLIPGAHTTNALHVYAAWITYTRKDN